MFNIFLALPAIAVVFLVFSGSSDASISSDLLQLAEVGKLVGSQKYQSQQEAIIMTASDKDSVAAKATIDAIRKDVLERHRSDGFFQEAVKPVIDAVLTAVRTVANGERIVQKEFDAALKLVDQNPDEATEIVKKILKYIPHFIYTSGVAIEDTYGAALALAGGANHRQMKISMDDIQTAGSMILESVLVAEEIAIKGIEAGGSAAVEGLKAAYEAFATGCTASFEYYHKSAQHALDAYAGSNDASVGISRENQVSGIIKALTSDVSTTSNAAALSAIASLQNGLQSMSRERIASQNATGAARIMTQALISTILETADAIATAKYALQEAGKLAIRDKKTAISDLQRGIEMAREEVIRGTTIGFLGFGAARHIAGPGVKMDGLIPAMVEIILGRVVAYDDLKLALDIALLGIRGGSPLSIAQGINAGLKVCDAAGKALFIQFAESGKMGLNIFGSN